MKSLFRNTWKHTVGRHYVPHQKPYKQNKDFDHHVQKPYKFIWYDLYGSFFDWEKGFPRTTYELFIRPGKVCWDYSEGGKHFVNPFRMFVVFGALSVFISTVIDLEEIQREYLHKAYEQVEKDFAKGFEEAQAGEKGENGSRKVRKNVKRNLRNTL